MTAGEKTSLPKMVSTRSVVVPGAEPFEEMVTGRGASREEWSDRPGTGLNVAKGEKIMGVAGSEESFAVRDLRLRGTYASR